MCEFSLKYDRLLKSIFYGLILLSLLLPHKSSAQYASDKGWFDANFVKGCPGFFVTITHTRVGAGTLFYGFEGDKDNPISGTSFTGSFDEGETATFQYNNPGTFYIVAVDQSGSGSTADRTDILEITVLPDVPPSATYTNCQGNTVQLVIDHMADSFDSYNILWGDGNQQIYPGDTPIEHTYSTPGVYDIFIGGRFDDGESSGCRLLKIEVSTFEELPTPVLETISVTALDEIELGYQPLSVGLSYTLQIDTGTGFQDYASIDPQTNPSNLIINDASFDTNNSFYGFKIVVEDICSTIKKESESGYSIAFELASSTVSTTYDLLVEWLTSDQNFTDINLLIDGSTYQTFNTFDNSSGETINVVNCNTLGTLTMTTDINGILSTSISQVPFESSPPLPPAINAPNAQLNGAVVEVSFSTTPIRLGEYVLYRKDITTSFNEVFSTSVSGLTDTTIPPGTAEACYKLAYRDECGNISELSDEVCLILATSLGIPNAFSPNGDGVNDIFKINDGIYANFSMLIYNRWGSLVFNTDDPTQGWDGEFEGTAANTGTYLYRISFQNADNLVITKTGSFVLIR